MNNFIETFRRVMAEIGLETPGEIVADGTLHRFTVPGDKPRSQNGWYVLHADSPAAGSFGCWKRQLNETWSAKEYRSMDPTEKAAYRAKMEAMKRQREEEQALIRAECRGWCSDVWAKAMDATNDHPYLKAKGVKSFRLKCFRGSLLIPVQDLAGDIHGMQFISPDGAKVFKVGTVKRGHFYGMGEAKGNTLCIAEGYATAASIHEATGYPVLAAFDAGNLAPVAVSIKARFPHLNIIICADNDQWTEGNPGLTKAAEAARAVGGLLAVPCFEGVRHE